MERRKFWSSEFQEKIVMNVNHSPPIVSLIDRHQGYGNPTSDSSDLGNFGVGQVTFFNLLVGGQVEISEKIRSKNLLDTSSMEIKTFSPRAKYISNDSQRLEMVPDFWKTPNLHSVHLRIPQMRHGRYNMWLF